MVDLDQAISRRYEAIDRIVSPIGQNDVCDTAFPLLECAVALAKERTQSPSTKLRGQMMQRLRGRSRSMIGSWNISGPSLKRRQKSRPSNDWSDWSCCPWCGRDYGSRRTVQGARVVVPTGVAAMSSRQSASAQPVRRSRLSPAGRGATARNVFPRGLAAMWQAMIYLRE